MPIKNVLFSIINVPAANVAGVTSTAVALSNSVFHMLNPVLTGIFYIASIGWLGVQIYYKIKRRGK